MSDKIIWVLEKNCYDGCIGFFSDKEKALKAAEHYMRKFWRKEGKILEEHEHEIYFGDPDNLFESLKIDRWQVDKYFNADTDQWDVFDKNSE